MARIPVRFERVAAAFDAAAMVRLCESSGSEHSPNDDDDLSDLVQSFIERDGVVSELDIDIFDHIDIESDQNNDNHQGSDNEGGFSWSDSEKKDSLRKLLGQNDDDDDDDVKRKLFDEALIGYGVIGDFGSIGFKRRLMTHLRNKGFDAGLCKSKWEKSKRFPAGDYEYVDVNVQGGRYIVEANLVGEFEIARPSDQYTSLVEIFPQVFVGKVGELKQIVRLMSTAMRHSMKTKDMPLPPWRRNGYMQAKWFGSYKRTTKSTPSKKSSDHKNSDSNNGDVQANHFESKRSIGFEFESFPTVPFYCNSGFAPKVGFRVSNLTAAFRG